VVCGCSISCRPKQIRGARCPFHVVVPKCDSIVTLLTRWHEPVTELHLKKCQMGKDYSTGVLECRNSCFLNTISCCNCKHLIKYNDSRDQNGRNKRLRSRGCVKGPRQIGVQSLIRPNEPVRNTSHSILNFQLRFVLVYSA
jgi:hypothetical protein